MTANTHPHIQQGYSVCAASQGIITQVIRFCLFLAVVMSNLITANRVSKRYGDRQALKDISFHLNRGQVVGLLGNNGAGKTTLLRCMMGMTTYIGDLSVLDLAPMEQRREMMQRIAFIADTAILPKWITLENAIKFLAINHCQFNMSKAREILLRAQIPLKQKIGRFSKGMVVQAHLGLLMAIDSELLILDEPTLGLDPLYRSRFYEHLMQEYFTPLRSIIISSHLIEEIEDLLTHVIMLRNGEVVLNASMADIQERFIRLSVNNQNSGSLLEKKPIHVEYDGEQTLCIFDKKFNSTIEQHGSRQPLSLSRLYIALMEKNID